MFLTVSSWQCGVERQTGKYPDVPEVEWLDKVGPKGVKTMEKVSMLVPYCPLSEGAPSDCCHTGPKQYMERAMGPLGSWLFRLGQPWGQIAKGQGPCGDEGHSSWSALTCGF